MGDQEHYGWNVIDAPDLEAARKHVRDSPNYRGRCYVDVYGENGWFEA